jgi:hypothetical protein
LSRVNSLVSEPKKKKKKTGLNVESDMYSRDLIVKLHVWARQGRLIVVRQPYKAAKYSRWETVLNLFCLAFRTTDEFCKAVDCGKQSLKTPRRKYDLHK